MDEEQQFTDFLSAELSGDGDTAAATPTETTEAPETEEQPAGDTAAATPEEGEDADLQALIAEARTRDPQFAELLDRSHKTWQRGVTPKLQEASDLRRQIEGLNPSQLEWFRHVAQTASLSPQAAAQILQQEAAQLLGQSAAPPEPASDNDAWMTDTERQLAQQTRSLQQRLEQIEQQTALARVQSEVQQQFDAVGRELGVEIPPAERNAFVAKMAQQNVPHHLIGELYKAGPGLQHIVRKAREEGERSLRAKQALPASPSGIAAREGGTAPPMPNDLREYLEMDPALR